MFPTIETSICTVDKQNELANFFKVTNLIIWDETPMAHEFCFEALDKILKDIMNDNKVAYHKIFIGKVVVFNGDFKQFSSYTKRL